MNTTDNKKVYRAVSLKKYGSVNELTKATTTFSGSDGGSGLNQYAS